ncbi:hypothetical protein [Streptomyces marispadix]|uniref:Secreted protein n=1 Tax=Streptomyces marispadix TaxID=2922868 RepID=A0ABS9ST50_9ACTN|nr:hypothetical protein [Streptomyces marispadix]MCH6159470.1 hypothetical protein [Streptomyces marispadix]
MLKMRTAAISVTSLLLATGGLIAGGMPAAAQPAGNGTAASAADGSRPVTGTGTRGEFELGCDAPLLFGYYGVTETFKHKGRKTRLETEKSPDWHAITTVKDVAYGDAISVQRSLKPFKMGDKPKHPSTVEVTGEGGGIKSCVHEVSWWEAGVKDKAKTDTVWLQSSSTRSYAVRACVHPYAEQTECSRWFVDHK